jgi:DNA-binding response OmpR family regulator
MRIGLFASNAALAEYFLIALGMADHMVTLYPAVQDLFSALTTAASPQGGAPHEVLLLELILDASGRQLLADLSGLAKKLGMPVIVLTTAGRDAIELAQAAFPEVCLRQLPLSLRALLALIQAHLPTRG